MGQYMYKGQLLAALSWGQVNKRFKVLCGRHLPVSYSNHPLKLPGLPPKPFKKTVEWVQAAHAPMPHYMTQVQ